MDNSVLLTSAGAATAAAYSVPTLCAYSPAALCIRAFRHLKDPRRVALTFDDGPHPEGTPRILDALDRLNAHATFFIVGQDAEKHPEVLQQIATAGHEIQNHGYRHRNHFLRNPLGLSNDIQRGSDVIESILGERPTLYRPPQGAVTAITRLGAWRNRESLVLWSTWGRDWRSKADGGSVFVDVVRRLSGGGIVLLHDSDSYAAPDSYNATLAALPRILEAIRSRGFAAGPIGGRESLRW